MVFTVRRHFVVLASSIGVLASGCSLLSGLDDVDIAPIDLPPGPNDAGDEIDATVRPNDDAATVVDAGNTDGSSPNDSGAPVDATTDAPPIEPPLTPTLATCGTNGLCLPVAQGWSPVAFLVVVKPPALTCPSNWPTLTERKWQPPGGCERTCKASSGSCAGSIDIGSGANCSTPSGNVSSVFTDGTCSNTTPNVPSPVSFTAHPTNPPTACKGTVSRSFPTPVPGGVCTGATLPKDAACAADEVCAPPSGSGMRCLMHDGEVACPANLSTRLVTGTKIEDNRSCGATCKCGPNNCADGQLSLYDNYNCFMNNPKRVAPTDGTCDTKNTAFQSVSVTYKAGTGCKVTEPPTVLGTEKIDAPTTICCPSSG